MIVVMTLLASVVALQYMLIGLYVVPRLARLADRQGRALRAAQWGAGAFFLGCGTTHAGIAVHMLESRDTYTETHLLLVHVWPHVAQVVGGATFIWVAARRMEVRFTAKGFAEVEAGRARAVEALARAEERLRTAFEHAPIGVALVSVEPQAFGRFVQVNPALCAITGRDEQDLLSTTSLTLAHPDDQEAAAEGLQRLSDGETPQVSIETRYLHRSGDPVWVAIRAALVRGEDPAPRLAVAQIQDITERKRYETQLQYHADHDPLTGLYNRRRLAAEIDRAVAFVRRYGTPGAVLVVDLDNFKYINDTYGHAVGDEVIGRVAGTLRARLRDTDVVGRLGGDEFAILLYQVTLPEARAVAEDLLDAVRSQPAVVAGDRRVRVTASVGINPIDPAGGLTGDELLVEADVAMYEAKETGRNRAALAGGEDGRHYRMRARLTWYERIRDALDHDGFELYEQPIMALASGQIERSELLLRMRAEDGDLIPPAAFLYVAERFGQIQAIDRWVVRQAVKLLAERRAASIDHHLEVNLSGASITDEEVIDFIAQEVASAPIDPSRLVFEVTETAAIVNVERARRFAGRLADLGCGFALDDFGAGFGSFYYLKHLPFDAVKIDGDFIQNLAANVPDQLTVKAIVQIARGLGKETIAEFVGDERTVHLLREYGVDHVQGYHVGRPVPARRPGARVVAVGGGP
jgi:diguanylate cyclase (GGDEF)-like protein/PAS domain S-box-containing protein